MVLSFSAQLCETPLHRHFLLIYVTTWTMFITATVAIVSLSPEIAFTLAVSPPSSFSSACRPGFIRLPMDGPLGELVCLPAWMFERCKLDLAVPPLFAALIVAGAVCIVRSIGLWEVDDDMGG